MRAISLQGLQQQLTAVTASASTIGDAHLVRVAHISTTGSLIVFVADRNGTNTTSTTLTATDTVYIQKEPSDKMWASDTSGYATRVVFVY
jgi:hypothetical protein